jgi:two-component system, cell cycle response regulator
VRPRDPLLFATLDPMARQPPRSPKGDAGEFKTPVTMRFPNVTSSLPPAVDENAVQRVTEKALSIPPTKDDRDRASLTLLTGPDAGQVFALDAETIIGRDFSAHVRIEDPSISRSHARIVRQPNGAYLLEDLQSTNGTFVGVDRVESRVLVSGDRMQLGPMLTLRFAITDEAEEMLQRQLFESSTRDHLTRIYNRRYLMTRLAAEVAHARRHGSSLAILLFDIDLFKATNDLHGHLVGDAVLRAIGDHVSALIRVEDVFARFGGEEFVVLIRGATGSSLDAVRLAERVRVSVAALTIRAEGAAVRVTISVGVGSLAEVGPGEAGQELIALADARLFRAKNEGRNRVVSE